MKRKLCFTIVLMRKFGTFLLAIVLFVSLLGLAVSVSSNLAFTHPAKVKTWLNQSNLYGNLVTDAIKQSQQTNNNASSISLNDPAIQKIARSTFSAQQLQGSVDTIVDSNYTWLEGKSSTPNFRVDLTAAKDKFAQSVGDYVQSYLSGLPACTATQLSETDQSGNALSLTCLPPTIDPTATGSQISDEISSSGTFLSDPVITANNLNPKGDNESQPYYQSLSGLPAVYQFGLKIPLIAALGVFASLIGVIFIPKRHRNGAKVAGIVLMLAGIVLVIAKFISGAVFDAINSQVFNTTSGDQAQKAFITVLGYAENQVAKTNLWFGLAYIIIAISIFVILRRSRKAPAASSVENVSDNTPTPDGLRTSPAPSADIRLKAQRPRPITPTHRAPGAPERPKRRKPPRLIQ